MADDTGISNSQALAALAGKKSLPTIQAGIVSRMSAEDQKALEAAMAKASKTISGHFAGMEVSSELSERILSAGSTVIGSRLPGVVTVPSTRRTPSVAKEEQPRRKDRQLPAQEQIARRVFKRQRQAVISMLRATGMKTEIEELRSVESKLAKGSKRSCMHAAYSARVLLEGVANHLFPPTTEKWVGRDKREHALGPNDFKNRLIAFVERNLGSQFEGEEFRAFVGTLDLVMRWTGGGPHGSHEPHDAEHLYTRLLDALSVIARAHAAQSA
ncbi:MAG TPA: hypothetical protein VFW48_07150 [Solirubrobacterales bacterium]|nr:hypothetical protein [Solirubrobacterales bacterium]